MTSESGSTPKLSFHTLNLHQLGRGGGGDGYPEADASWWCPLTPEVPLPSRTLEMRLFVTEPRVAGPGRGTGGRGGPGAERAALR